MHHHSGKILEVSASRTPSGYLGQYPLFLFHFFLMPLFLAKHVFLGGKRHNRVHPGHFATQQSPPFYPAGMSAADWSTLVFTLPTENGLGAPCCVVSPFFFGDYAAAYATFRWLCFRLCSIFRGHICPKKGIMLLHKLLFGAYAIYYALILGSNMLSRGDCATAVLLLYGRFRLIYSGFWY